MISYNTWINNTKLPSKRTTALTTVDDKLRTYESARTQPNLDALKRAWNAWKSAKGNWKNSDRFKKATGNPNPLQQLESDLLKETVPPPAPILPIGGRPLPPGGRVPPLPPGGRAPALPVTNPVGVGPQPIAAKPKPSGGIKQDMGADAGPGKMTAEGKELVSHHRATLLKLGAFACLDAGRFGGSEAAKKLQKEAEADVKRTTKFNQSTQAAGGKASLQQAHLKSVYEASVEGEVGICTTFAIAAAHVLTEGKRQTGNVRVEVMGVKYESGAAHCYAVVGRTQGNPGNMSTWNSTAIIVDPWYAAAFEAGQKSLHVILGVDYCTGKKNWDRGPGTISRYYDNSVPDPAETNTAVNTGALNKNKLLSDIRLKEQQLKAKPEWDQVGRRKLQEEIDKLTLQYNS